MSLTKGNTSSWYLDDDIVITGISGRYPESDNVEEFKKNLFDGVDMVTEDDRRWKTGMFGTPKGMGKLKDINRFDNLFFEVHDKQAAIIDPAMGILLETVYEAIFDSGYNPSSLSGSRIGVYVGSCGSSFPEPMMANSDVLNIYGLTGNSVAMLSNRVSYSFNFNGPSLTVDTACSASFTALNEAFLALKSGQCQAAVVAGATIHLRFLSTQSLHGLGILSPDGRSKSFDSSANGTARAESVCAIFLQRVSDARRIYATVLNCKASNDGKKPQGITHPSFEMQKTLLQQVYKELEISPSSVRYFEAHGTGTKAGDGVEGRAIQDVFCVDRKEPLLIGAVKSNTGHTEGASGMVSVAKAIISMEEGSIPANLHFKKPNPDIPALHDGRMKLVSEHTPFPGGIVGINNFGMGGSNVHLVIRPNNSARYEPAKERSIPRLVLSCGRTENSVRYILNTVSDRNFNDDALALLEDASISSRKMLFRGFSLLEGSGSHTVDITTKKAIAEERPVWFLYSGMGSQWSGMAKDMMRLEPFAKSIRSSAEILKPLGVDLLHLLTEATEEELSYIVSPFVTIAAVQIALTQLLKSMNVEPDGIVGHSVGELGCAFADGCFTAEQMLLAAYWRGQSCVMSTLIYGRMAAVGMTWDEALKRCPPGVYPVCNNAKDSVTISGPAADVSAFVEQLKAESIFAREVKTGDIAFHSKYVEPAADIMRQKLKDIIPNPKARSLKWISSSVPEEDWQKEKAKYSSVDYHINNLLSPVLFDQAMTHVPKNAIIIEIGPHSLLEPIVKGIMGADACYVDLMQRNIPNNLEHFLKSIGMLYTMGVNPSVKNLYKPVVYPVPRGTPMLNSLIIWDHSQQNINWNFQSIYKDKETLKVDTNKNCPFEYLRDRKVDGRILFPASGYLWLAWRALAQSSFLMPEEMPVVIEDVQFLSAAVLPKDGIYEFKVSVLECSGAFTIHDKGVLLCRGTIRKVEDTELQERSNPGLKVEEENNIHRQTFLLDAQSFYKELRLRGYEYGPCFRNFTQIKSNGLQGLIRWTDNWVTFIDTILQMVVMHDPYRMLVLPTKIQKISIDPSMKPITKGQEIPVFYNPRTNRQSCGPVEIESLQCTLASRKPLRDGELLLEEYRFSPYFDLKALSDQMEERVKEYSEVCSTLALSVLKCIGRKGWLSLVLDNTKPAPEDIVHKYLAFDDNEHILLKALQDILSAKASNKSDEDAIKQIRVDHNRTRNDFISTLPFAESVLTDSLQLVLNNHFSPTLNVLEISHRNVVYPHVYDCFKTYLAGFITLNYTLARTNKDDKTEIEETVRVIEVNPEDYNLPKNHDLVVGKDFFTDNALSARVLLNVLVSSVKDNGFILLMERTAFLPAEEVVHHLTGNKRKCVAESDLEESFAKEGLVVVAKKKDRSTFVTYLLRKIKDCGKPDPVVYKLNKEREYYWVEELQRVIQKEIASEAKREIWIVSDYPESGIVGFMNALRFEENGHRLRFYCNCGLEDGGKPPIFDLKDKSIQDLVRRSLRSNVYRQQQWGMFLYRFLDKDIPKVICADTFLNVKEYGDFSGLRWIESPLKYWTPQHKDDTKVQVYCSALNSLDVMITTGKLQTVIAGFAADLPFNQDCRMGFEFSGIEEGTGRRVMGIVSGRGLASSVVTTKEWLLDVPPQWTLEEASSVPIVYLTAYYALVVRGRIRRGQSILIHSGSVGVGQAAIAICLNMGCDVYTTVGSDEKKQYLLLRFPELKRENIFNSRTLDFEINILNRTIGRGVDIVLNSLAEDKLKASVRCLRTNGKFLEIGKYDIMMDHPLGLGYFIKNIEFHGVHLNTLMHMAYHEDLKEVFSLLKEGIASGVVKPLKTTVYPWAKAEEAFSFLASGKHIGKVIIKIRDEELTGVIKIPDSKIPSVPQTYFDPKKSVLVTGGLGGLGFELCHWLIRRGVKHIAISSRTGIKNSYQRLWIQRWTEQGVKISICNQEITKIEGCRNLLKEVNAMAPVGSIFHLALVVTNSLFIGVKREIFMETCNPKVEGIRNLDVASRELCPHLDHFCAFSTLVASSGAPGLSSYAYANSAMEKIIERRRNQGLCGQAIEYGAIGEVGILYEEYQDVFNFRSIRGTDYQSVESCFYALDRLIQENLPVTLSTVRSHGFVQFSDHHKDLVHHLCVILGISNEKKLSPDMTLGNLGMDSLMVVETKNLLELEHDTVLNVQEILKLTIRELREIDNKRLDKQGTRLKGK